jgi:prevent-host-death family protein
MLTLKESIRPSADLRNHYNDISKQCKENKEAVIITVNGRGDTVALSYEEYKNIIFHSQPFGFGVGGIS